MFSVPFFLGGGGGGGDSCFNIQPGKMKIQPENGFFTSNITTVEGPL